MASSQVELPPSPSPFGCVLRDRNHRDRYRQESSTARGVGGGSAHVMFEKKLKDLVRDHLNTCTAIMDGDRDRDADENTNSNTQRLTTHHHRLRSHGGGLTGDVPAPAVARIKTPRARSSSPVSRETTPPINATKSDVTVEIPNLGVSSIVQRWRNFEAVANLSHPSPVNSVTGLSRNNSCASNALEEPPRISSETSDSGDDAREADPPAVETAAAPPSQEAEQESERIIRVADIIRKLTTDDGGDSPLSRERLSLSDPTGEQRRSFSQVVVSSPRIRGRQAFTDLLMQMERDRRRELDGLVDRGPVSRFQQRGRIQSMLRLKILHRGMGFPEQLSSPSTGSWDRLQKRPIVTPLRGRFNAPTEAAHGGETITPKINHHEKVSSTEDVVHHENARKSTDKLELVEHSSIDPNTATEIIHHEKGSSTDTSDPESPTFKSVTPGEIFNHEKIGSTKRLEEPSTCELDVPSEFFHHKKKATVSKRLNLTSAAEQMMKHNEIGHQEEDVSSSVETNETVGYPHKTGADSSSGVAWQGETSSNSLDVNSQVSPDSQAAFFSDWEDYLNSEGTYGDFNNYQDYMGIANHDWFSDISRPQREWEDRRQARYREILDTTSSDNDIRKLLERKTVSSFLGSDLRDTMDKLMSSFLRKPSDQNYDRQGGGRGESEEVHLQMGKEDSEEQADIGTVDAVQEEMEREEEMDEDDDIDGVEEGSPIGGNYYDVSDYLDQSSTSPQMPTPKLLKVPWSRYHNHEICSDGSDQVASTSFLQRPPASQVYGSNNQQSPCCSNHHASMDMELMYDLRRHVEQLHHEISELRISLKSCMEMQAELQYCMNEKGQAAVHHSVGDGDRTNHRAPRKGYCSVCFQTRVDSFLYSCGHMCTCFKCANELHWSNQKCPICRAPIVDVVKAYVDS